MRYLRILSFAFAIASQALTIQFSFAGPNRNVHIDDQPFGHTLTHVYWVRTIDDNVSSYDQHLTHIFLVKQSLKTAKVERHWLLRRLSWANPVEVNAAGTTDQKLEIYEPPITEYEGKPKGSPPDAALYRNPFDVLRAEKAVSVSQLYTSPANTDLSHWKVLDQVGLVLVDKDDLPKIDETLTHDVRLTTSQIKGQMTASIWPSLEEMKRFTPNDPRSAIPPSSFNLSGDLGCIVENQLQITGHDLVRFLQLSCESDGMINFWKLWVAVR